MSKKLKKVIFLTLLILPLLFPFEAKAVAPLVIAAGLALVPLGLGIIKGAVSLIAFMGVAGGVSLLSGQLVNWGISFQNTLLNPANLPIIQNIWQLLRDFVNIFFILILLVIAFATIFNIKNYKASDLLPKLIIAALLINFSLVIAAWVVDLLWIPAGVFSKPLGQNVSGKIAEALRIQDFFSTENLLLFARNLFEGPYGVVELTLREGVFRGILLIINAFLISWIALIIWIRIPILLGLMIISPIAWLGYTLPAIKKRTWDLWWQKLFCWGSIPIPLFGLIYFVVLFNQRLKLEINQTTIAPVLNTVLPFLGFTLGQTLVWIITAGILLAGLMYIKGLSCSLYGWISKGFFGTWGGIRKWTGRAVDFGYAATGAAGAVGQVQKELIQGGIPIFGARRFGVAQREDRETRAEDWLRARAGLPPTYAAERKLLDDSTVASRDIENRLKRTTTQTERDEIIDALKQSVTQGKSDPETLAALSTLAKNGQLEKDVIERAIQAFEKTPLAIEKVFSNWKEGKFGGSLPREIIDILQNTTLQIPIEARRNLYGFTASEDGKGIAKEMNYNEFKAGADMVKGTKEETAYMKQFGGLKPTFVGEYKNPTDITSGTLDQVKKASFKTLAEYDEDEWNKVAFDSALRRLLSQKKQANLQDARKFVEELRKKLIEEGKNEQLTKLVQIAMMQNLA